MEQSSLEQILPELLEKTYANKWRALVKIGPLLGEAAAELKRLDDYLWTYKKDGFLPHGRDDEPLSDAQPVLLTHSSQTLSGEDVVFLLGGAEMDDVNSAKRCITILNGADDEDKSIARRRWKQAKDDGLVTAYWRQNDFAKWEQPFK